MLKSELIEAIAAKLPDLKVSDVDLAVDRVIESLVETLAHGGRVEIRDFGSFSLVERKPRIGRNPKTGEAVSVERTHVVHFRPGLGLRKIVDASKALYRIVD